MRVHDPDCERTGDSCLVCPACADEVTALLEAGEVARKDAIDPDLWPDVPPERRTCCTHPGTGICMCDCHDWEPAR